MQIAAANPDIHLHMMDGIVSIFGDSSKELL
jgi:hypothetical protein